MLTCILGKENIWSLLVGMQTGAATMEVRMENSKELQIDLLYDLALSLLGNMSKVLNIILHKCLLNHVL